MADSSLIQPQSVLFSPSHVEVSFVEERNITPDGVDITTYQMNPNGLEPQIQDVLDAIAELVEAYQIRRRNPPPSIPSRKAQMPSVRE